MYCYSLSKSAELLTTLFKDGRRSQAFLTLIPSRLVAVMSQAFDCDIMLPPNYTLITLDLYLLLNL